MESITRTDLNLEFFSRGKVRDTYAMGKDLLMIATDRLSAFDVVFNEGIPHKGEVLTNLSIFWFMKTRDIVRNHFITNAIPADLPPYTKKRSMIVVRAEPIALECVVRGYITGSAFKEYQKTGSVCGIELPKGLKNGDPFPVPIFTPSTKAKTGHDENITEERAGEIVGEGTYKTIKEKSIALYEFARKHAERSGLVLADTKFEFGYQTNGEGVEKRKIILIDEALTPDSSRYWVKEKYDKGTLESLDKQYLRDYLEKTNWNKAPPPPPLPEDVIEHTSRRYIEAYRMLTGKDFFEGS